MSGYLDVKYSYKSNRGLNPFKTWKKQWCILRPSPTEKNGGAIVLRTSVGLSTNSTIDLPPGSTVCRTRSRTRAFAFGIFISGEVRKPHVLLAGQSETETQLWMAKIRAVLNGKKFFGSDILLKNSYSVSIIDNEFSQKCDMYGFHGIITISSHGLLISQPSPSQLKVFIAWKHITDISLGTSDNTADKNKICVLTTNRDFDKGAGEFSLFSASGFELVCALKDGLKESCREACERDKRLSRSEGDLHIPLCSPAPMLRTDMRRSSWYSGPSDVSLDDTDLILAKDTSLVPSGMLARCNAASELHPPSLTKPDLLNYISKFSTKYNDSADRCSLVSIASGIYEEIPEDLYLDVSKDCQTEATETKQAKAESEEATLEHSPLRERLRCLLEENTYESVSECVYATMRRTGKRHPPPPLPPRLPFLSMKSNEGWSPIKPSKDGNVVRHNSLGSLPRCYSISSNGSSKSNDSRYTKTLPKFDKTKQAFSAFRKRIKSESRITGVTPKPELNTVRLEENKTAIDVKKKKFDFSMTPSKSKDIFRKFRVSKTLMKSLKISSTNLSKVGETKSCEFLDSETEHVTANRCTKSVESLDASQLSKSGEDSDIFCDTPDSEGYDIEGQDLSLLYSERAVESLSLPPDIVELILKGREDLAELHLRRRQMLEDHYMPMSPAGAEPLPEPHYAVMHPARTHAPTPTNVA